MNLHYTNIRWGYRFNCGRISLLKSCSNTFALLDQNLTFILTSINAKYICCLRINRQMPIVTKISINNFKKLENISFNLVESVVIIGPNNAGKSTIFQALCLWEIGVVNFLKSYRINDLNSKGAVTINRKDLLNSPISDSRFLWRNKKVTKKNSNTDRSTSHIILSVEVEGEKKDGKPWKCKCEFTFSNAESFSCKIPKEGIRDIIDLYENDEGIHFCFLQPMSGISTDEDKFTEGSIERRLGEGRTAEVLRNICYGVIFPEVESPGNINKIDSDKNWQKLTDAVRKMFGCELHIPEYIKGLGILKLEYTEENVRYDISTAGRGFQQTLLLLAYMYSHPGTVLLLDEPDAHLEVIRQREVFKLINEVANEVNSQLIIASHSEVVLEEAADASKVIALIENTATELNQGGPIQDIRYLKKVLTEIGWEKYYLAKIKGHIIYLEGATDLSMLKEFAKKIKHPAEP